MKRERVTFVTFTAQESSDVAYSSETYAQHQWVSGGVAHLIESASVKSSLGPLHRSSLLRAVVWTRKWVRQP
mgnify:CR=1 FL=1